MWIGGVYFDPIISCLVSVDVRNKRCGPSDGKVAIDANRLDLDGCLAKRRSPGHEEQTDRAKTWLKYLIPKHAGT